MTACNQAGTTWVSTVVLMSLVHQQSPASHLPLQVPQMAGAPHSPCSAVPLCPTSWPSHLRAPVPVPFVLQNPTPKMRESQCRAEVEESSP